jgi:hypothetical protein
MAGAGPSSHVWTLRAQAAVSPVVQRLQALQSLAYGQNVGFKKADEQVEQLQEELTRGDLSNVDASNSVPEDFGAMPKQLRAGIEGLSGVSMAGVKVHRDSPAPAQVGAQAFADGNEIHLAPGQDRHLPHEAWHVVQQAKGRVRPTTKLHGAMINNDPSLEAEADKMGARAAAGAVSSEVRVAATPVASNNSGLQRKAIGSVLQLQQTDVCLKSAAGTYTTPNNATPTAFNFSEGSKGSDVMQTTKSHPSKQSDKERMAESYLKKMKEIPRDATVTFTSCDTYGIKK